MYNEMVSTCAIQPDQAVLVFAVGERHIRQVK